MAENPNSNEMNLSETLIELKVFTQLPQIDGSFQLMHVRAGSSIREVKEQILETLLSRPSVERQRLIYRGRVLARDTDTLINVFGRESIQRQERQTVHLVIRELVPSTSSTTSTASNAAIPPPTPARPPPAQSHLGPSSAHLQGPSDSRVYPPRPLSHDHTNLNESHSTHTQHTLHPQVQGQPRSNSPSVLPQSPFQPPLPLRGPTPTTGSLHQQLHQQAHPQAHLQAHLQAAHQAHQLALQQAHQSLFNRPTGPPHTVENPPFGNLPSNNLQLPNNVTNQVPVVNQTPLDQAHPVQSDTIPSAPQAGHQPRSAETFPTASAPHSQQRPASDALGTTQETNIRDHLGSDLTSITPPPHDPLALYNMPIQTAPGSRYATQPLPHSPGRPIRNPSPTHLPPTTSAGFGMAPFSIGPSRWHPHYLGWDGPAHAIEYMQTLQERLQMALQLCRWCYPPVDDPTRPVVITHGLVFLRDLVTLRNVAQASINSVLRYGPPADSSAPTPQQVSELQTLNFRFRSLVRDWMSDFEGIRDGSLSHADRTTASSSSLSTSSAQQSQTTATPVTDPSAMAYILHSSNGPVAVLYNGQGVYSSLPSGGTTTLPAISNAQDNRNISNRQQQARNPLDAPALHGALPNMANQINNVNEERIRQGLQQLRNRAQGEPNVIAVNLTPFLQALWLFVRVYVFIWVFLGGRGLGDRFLSWQTLGLFAIIAAYGALRVGIGAERFEVLRRYWNDLVGVVPAQDQRQNQARPEQARNAPAQPQPTDEIGAADSSRVDHNHQQEVQNQRRDTTTNHGGGRGEGSLREFLRPFERTVALFLGSLYPGVGERHIAERERMRREAEERDRMRAAAAAQEEQRRPSTTSLPSPSTPSTANAISDQQQQDSVEVDTLESSHNQSSAAKRTTSDQPGGSQGSSSAIETTPEGGDISQRRTNDNVPNTDET